jgi:hypothetical protein
MMVKPGHRHAAAEREERPLLRSGVLSRACVCARELWKFGTYYYYYTYEFPLKKPFLEIWKPNVKLGGFQWLAVSKFPKYWKLVSTVLSAVSKFPI